MPRVILEPEGRTVDVPANATLADALRAAGQPERVVKRAVTVVAGEDRLTPPLPEERRRFGGVDWTRRLPRCAGIIGEATIRIRLGD